MSDEKQGSMSEISEKELVRYIASNLNVCEAISYQQYSAILESLHLNKPNPLKSNEVKDMFLTAAKQGQVIREMAADFCEKELISNALNKQVQNLNANNPNDVVKTLTEMFVTHRNAIMKIDSVPSNQINQINQINMGGSFAKY